MATIKQYPKGQSLMAHNAERGGQRPTAEGQGCPLAMQAVEAYTGLVSTAESSAQQDPLHFHSTGDLLYMVTSKTPDLRKPPFFKGQEVLLACYL